MVNTQLLKSPLDVCCCQTNICLMASLLDNPVYSVNQSRHTFVSFLNKLAYFYTDKAKLHPDATTFSERAWLLFIYVSQLACLPLCSALNKGESLHLALQHSAFELIAALQFWILYIFLIRTNKATKHLHHGNHLSLFICCY